MTEAARAAMLRWTQASVALVAVVSSDGPSSPNVQPICDEITAASLLFGREMLLEQSAQRGPKS